MENISYKIPFFTQYKWIKKDRNYWSKRVCGLACLKMFLHFKNWVSPSFDKLIRNNDRIFTVLSMIDWVEKKYPYFTQNYGWLHYALISIAREYGMQWVFYRDYTRENFLDKIYSQLKNGYFVLTSINRYPEYKWTKRWHLIVITWIEFGNKNTYLIVNDPARKKWNTKITLKTFAKNFNYVSILFSDKTEEKFLANYPIYISEKIFKNSKINYIHIHENEVLAREVTQKFIKKNWWKLIEIHQNNERFLRFEVQDGWEKIFFRIDPNRIFDNENMIKTIEDRNSHLDIKLLPQALKKVEFIKNYILSKIDTNAPILVGIHNNKLLNISDFLSKTEYVNINPNMSCNSFVQTTNIEDFEYFKFKNINCVYFNSLENDGWLADYFQKSKKRFLTIETWYENKEDFEKILELIWGLEMS